MTGRDEMALHWFRVVRISNMQTIRWLLGAVNGWERPVQIRQAQRWVSRMETAGMLRRAQLGGPGGALVWATFEVTRGSKPNIHAQTTRHEIAVSAASARYAAAGWAWRRDDRPEWAGSHQADGVAIGIDGDALLVEVELTPKRAPRYARTFSAYSHRLDRGEASRVVYLCNPDSARAARAALRQPAARRITDHVDVHIVFEPHSSTWNEDQLPTWLRPPQGLSADRPGIRGIDAEELVKPASLEIADARLRTDANKAAPP